MTAQISSPNKPTLINATRQSVYETSTKIPTGAQALPKKPEKVCIEKARPNRSGWIDPFRMA
jgi:hypothetical protein